jgi:hypothetical protein
MPRKKPVRLLRSLNLLGLDRKAGITGQETLRGGWAGVLPSPVPWDGRLGRQVRPLRDVSQNYLSVSLREGHSRAAPNLMQT